MLGLVLALAAPAAAQDDELMRKEVVGGLRLGATAASVVKALGPPAQKGKIDQRGSDGDYVQTWKFPARGLELTMRAAKRAGAQTIDAIVVNAPSTLKTSRGIGIGSTLAELQRAYGADRNPEDSTADSFVAGSTFGGVIFQLEAGRVRSIFVGAAAE